MWSGRVSLDQTIEAEQDIERDGEATAHLCVVLYPLFLTLEYYVLFSRH
jgi:hypothetical protein